jgi:diguanylate cyclase (GGDEF)-like protein
MDGTGRSAVAAPVAPLEAGAAPERTAAEVAAALALIEDAPSYDIDAWLVEATGLERIADRLGDQELVLRARLVRADVWQRRGRTAPAVQVFWAVIHWATEHDCRPLLARAHRLLALTYQGVGDAAAFLDHSVRAVEFLDESTSPIRRVYHLMALAMALGQVGSFDAARERFVQAEHLTIRTGDVERQLLVLNNLADIELRSGQAHRARATVDRLIAAAAADGRGSVSESTYLGTIAEVQIAVGEYAEAERTARAALQRYHDAGYDEVHALANHLLTLAIAQRHTGATDAAAKTLDACAAVCEERELRWIRVETLRERAELYAAAGDPGRAFETHKVFHAADKELISRQREAQARNRQALFETAEARREAERFREQARRDPLTGLRNRRYVDEELPALIDHAVTTGAPMVVALVDLDHFKRVNDTLSHEVGDQVLVTVASIFGTVVPGADGGGFAARLGGEEFLLVLTGPGHADAMRRLDHLRRTVAAHHWRPITGALPVTVSIGATAVQNGGTQASLLAAADAQLYRAKADGRDRVRVAAMD